MLIIATLWNWVNPEYNEFRIKSIQMSSN